MIVGLPTPQPVDVGPVVAAFLNSGEAHDGVLMVSIYWQCEGALPPAAHAYVAQLVNELGPALHDRGVHLTQTSTCVTATRPGAASHVDLRVLPEIRHASAVA